MADADQVSAGSARRVVGRYEILREIGRGGMAVVYAAIQPDLDRQVALKELSRFHAGSAEFAHRFLRESRLAGSLNHPNIVTVHEYFEHEGTPYIAMEYVSRGSLRGYIKRMSLTQIAGVLEGVLAGLAHAESAGIVHRDLKPENIMVTADGRVKITDFGIARATERAGTQFMTATGMTVGTPTYMAPEQAMAGEIGPWTDLYSVGVLTYELLVGHAPFHDTEAPMVILMRHVNEPIPSAITIRPELDQRLSDWIDSLLVKEPLDRVRHAVDAWESLEEIILGLQGPLWRRDARLLDDRLAVLDADPLTPAPFESGPMRTPTPASSEAVDPFVTFAPGSAAPPAGPPADATPGPDPVIAPSTTTPPPEPVIAPSTTTPPSEPVIAPSTTTPPPAPVMEPYRAEQEPTDESASSADGFVTYGRSVAPPPPTPTPLPTEATTPPAITPSIAPPEPPSAAELTEPESREEPATEPAPAPEEPYEREPVAEIPAEPPIEPTSAERTDRAHGAAGPGVRAQPRRGPIGILAAVACVVAAAVGFVVAPSSHAGTGRPVALTQRATSGPATVLVPQSWTISQKLPPDLRALGLSAPVALTPDAAATGGGVVFGTITGPGAPLLPAEFAGSFTTAPEVADFHLGSNTLVGYLDFVRGSASPTESIYALPTKRGTVTVVCVLPPSGSVAFAVTCQRIVATLTTTAQKLPLTANSAYGRSLSSIVAGLNSAMATSGAKLARAATRQLQSSAAQALSRSFHQQAMVASALTPGPSATVANGAIAQSLRQLSSDYHELSGAAAHGDGVTYARARKSITDHLAALSKALLTLRQTGYRIS